VARVTLQTRLIFPNIYKKDVMVTIAFLKKQEKIETEIIDLTEFNKLG
jgi:hypothetical protein